MTFNACPQRGDVYLVRAIKSIGDTKKRPSIIVSNNSQNQHGVSVIVVPLTRNLSGRSLETRVFIASGEGGTEADSLAACDRIMSVKKSYLERGPYGSLSEETMNRIVQGVQVAIGAGRLG